MALNVRIITPKGLYTQLNVESLTVKLTTGYRTILEGHMPLIGALDIAPMHVIMDGKTIYYALHGGAINITNEGATLIVNAIEKKEDIDKERALKAKERAIKRLNEKDINTDVKRAEAALQRSLTRIETLSK